VQWFALSSLFWLALGSPAFAQRDLDPLFDHAGVIWQATPEQFMQEYRSAGFRWLSTTSPDAARSAEPDLRFLGLRVWESVVRFAAGKPHEITLSLYNRGDAGDLDEAEFAKFMVSLDANLTQWAGEKGVLLRTPERTTVATVRRKSWVKDVHRVDLVWGLSERSRAQGIAAVRPEFARLQFTRFDLQNDPRKLMFAAPAPTKAVSVLDLRARVQRAPNGDVIITGIPMVDQGPKGYCAAAVAERLLRYYGRSLDQHEIAQLANTTAQGGTNPQNMMAALRRIGDEVRMDVDSLRDFDGRDFEKMLDDYNRAARKVKKPEFELVQRNGNFVYVNDPVQVYTQLDAGLLKAARLKREAGRLDFQQTVSKYVKAGAPLAWSVMLGKIKETPDIPGFGGHMRLIIGFNDRTGEILYSDSWGAGHERKRLSLDDAWTITLGYYCLRPRDIRF